MKHRLLILAMSLVVALLLPSTTDAQFRNLKVLGNHMYLD